MIYKTKLELESDTPRSFNEYYKYQFSEKAIINNSEGQLISKKDWCN